MSSILPRDPLLGAAKLVVGAAIGIIGFAAAMVAIGLGAILTVQRDKALAKLSAAGIDPSGYPMLLLAMVLLIAMLTLAILFMRELWRIVRSVEEGDPFNPVNAGRLARMGWLSLSGQVTLFVIAGIATWFRQMTAALLAEDAFNLSLGAIVLTLVLFILARVFRIGAAMRDDLQGTV